MNLEEAKERFVNAWGTLGSSWGISRTMAQIHALLLVSADPLGAEDVMSQLNISRGNTNMNLRALMDWGLVKKEFRSGERREFFSAEKDMWKVFRQIAKERRKRELEPIFNVLQEVAHLDEKEKTKEVKAFENTIEGIKNFAGKADKTLETLIKADENWFLSAFLKVIK
jgi:DNA-binding transcriptional regulator GbsR (MarR family)